MPEYGVITSRAIRVTCTSGMGRMPKRFSTSTCEWPPPIRTRCFMTRCRGWSTDRQHACPHRYSRQLRHSDGRKFAWRFGGLRTRDLSDRLTLLALRRGLELALQPEHVADDFGHRLEVLGR